MKEKVERKTVRYVYTRDNEGAFYVNGICGGITEGKGELVANFFLARAEWAVYEETIEKTLVNGKPQEKRSTLEKYNPPETVVAREIRVTLVIPVAEVGTIASWMMKTIRDLQDTRQTASC